MLEYWNHLDLKSSAYLSLQMSMLLTVKLQMREREGERERNPWKIKMTSSNLKGKCLSKHISQWKKSVGTLLSVRVNLLTRLNEWDWNRTDFCRECPRLNVNAKYLTDHIKCTSSSTAQTHILKSFWNNFSNKQIHNCSPLNQFIWHDDLAESMLFYKEGFTLNPDNLRLGFAVRVPE